MAKYTVTIYELIQSGWDFDLKNYPLWSERYRQTLNKKILDHYMFREIGFETPQMFNFYINRTLNEIMPYYNQLYETTILDFDPLSNYKIDETIDYDEIVNLISSIDNETQYKDDTDTGFDGKTSRDITSITHNDSSGTTDTDTNTDSNSNQSGNSHSDTSTTDLYVENGRYSDTPQGMLSKGFMSDDTWASAANQKDTSNNGNNNQTAINETDTDSRQNTESNTKTSAVNDVNQSDTGDVITNNNTTTSSNGSGTSNTDTKSNTDKDSNRHRVASGYMGITPYEIIKQMRDLIINIDMMIIDDLSELFMGIY